MYIFLNVVAMHLINLFSVKKFYFFYSYYKKSFYKEKRPKF